MEAEVGQRSTKLSSRRHVFIIFFISETIKLLILSETLWSLTLALPKTILSIRSYMYKIRLSKQKYMHVELHKKLNRLIARFVVVQKLCFPIYKGAFLRERLQKKSQKGPKQKWSLNE